MAINAESRLDFQIAFKKIMLMIALESVRETYGMLLRDIARFEHKAALKKLKGEKLKTNIVHMGKFISELCAVQEIARGNKVIAPKEDAKKENKGLLQNFTLKNAGNVVGALGLAAIMTVLGGAGAVVAGGVAKLTLSPVIITTISNFTTLSTLATFAAGITGGAPLVAAAISSLNTTSFNKLYKQNKNLYDEEKIDQKFKASASEYDIAYKSKSRNKKDSCPFASTHKTKKLFLR